MSYQIFYGGEDWNPDIYDEPKHPKAGPFNPTRDVIELQQMHDCFIAGIPMIGVCRGAQGLALFAGHKLHQHIDGHRNSNHPIYFNDDAKKLLGYNSVNEVGDHHQVIWHRPEGGEYQLIAVSEEDLPEIVYYPEIKALAIQGHPEWDMGLYKRVCNTLVKHYLGVKDEVF